MQFPNMERKDMFRVLEFAYPLNTPMDKRAQALATSLHSEGRDQCHHTDEVRRLTLRRISFVWAICLKVHSRRINTTVCSTQNQVNRAGTKMRLLDETPCA